MAGVRVSGFHYTSPFVVANQNQFTNVWLYLDAASLWASGMHLNVAILTLIHVSN